MSVFLTATGAASSYQETGTLLQHLSMSPSGYATQASNRATSASTTYEVVFRIFDYSASRYVLGSTSSILASLVVLNANNIRVIGQASMADCNIPSGLVPGTWYRVSVSKFNSSISINVYNHETSVLIGSTNQTITIGNISLHYLGRYLNSYYDVDIASLKWGSISAPDEHIWVPQSSGTIWTDTGTVGGWNFTLTGSPLPTWVT